MCLCVEQLGDFIVYQITNLKIFEQFAQKSIIGNIYCQNKRKHTVQDHIFAISLCTSYLAITAVSRKAITLMNALTMVKSSDT